MGMFSILLFYDKIHQLILYINLFQNLLAL